MRRRFLEHRQLIDFFSQRQIFSMELVFHVLISSKAFSMQLFPGAGGLRP